MLSILMRRTMNRSMHVAKPMMSMRNSIIETNVVTKIGYLRQPSYLSLTQKYCNSYSRCKDSVCSEGSEYLRSYLSTQDGNERKLSRPVYLTFKRNMDSVESIELLVEYLGPLTKSLSVLSFKQSRRLFKLILHAEKWLLSSAGAKLPFSKDQLLNTKSLTDRITQINSYLSWTFQSKQILKLQHENQTQEGKKIKSAEEKLFDLKESVCNHALKRLARERAVLSSFKAFTYLSVPAIFYALPYSSLLFLHPSIGGTYYHFAKLSLQEHKFLGFFITLLLAGSLSYAFVRTFDDMYSLLPKNSILNNEN